MKVSKYIVLALAMSILSLSLQAQNEKESPLGFGLQLKSMHLWRGLQVASEATAAVDVHISDKKNMFTAGIWGGAGFSGKFKEFDYYASFQHKGLQIALWDIYNFSEGASYNNTQVFNYNARETGHFVDLSVGYTFQGSFPLTVSWATVIFGRDRTIALDGDASLANQRNRYSTYVSLSYPVLKDKFIDLELGIAGAFALDPQKGTSANFYADNAGIVNVNFVVSKKLELGKYTLPVSVMGMWNPEGNNANIQIALDVLKF